MKVTLQFDLRVVLRWVLALIFAWAALSKLANDQDNTNRCRGPGCFGVHRSFAPDLGVIR